MHPPWRLRPLPRRFFARPAELVARELLGKIVRRAGSEGPLAGRIVETEAYLGGDDQAAHAYVGVTDRTRVIYGPPGHAYVYLSYGIHTCLNFVAESEGQAGCVLIRALEPVAGLDEMRLRRPKARRDRDLASGPGKLTAALGVVLGDYGADLTRGPITVHEPRCSEPFAIGVSRRIGITKSVDLPLRFFIEDNEHVSSFR